VTARRIVGAVVALLGAAGVTACLLALSAGMRDVMQADGGVCASGGPYIVAHQCSTADIHLVMIGILGGLLAAAFYVGGSAGIGGRASSAALLLWTALFGLLGWNFIKQGHQAGLLTTGVSFWVMAAGGLAVALTLLIGDLRDGGRSGPAASVQPLVRAAVPGMPGTAGTLGAPGMQPGTPLGFEYGAPQVSAAPGPVARGSAALWAVAWLVVSVAGTGLGIALSHALITALRG
jgi:hypothetical protein